MARAYQTEHKKLLIIPAENLMYDMFKSPINARNIDLHTYINSKFTFLEKHTKKTDGEHV